MQKESSPTSGPSSSKPSPVLGGLIWFFVGVLVFIPVIDAAMSPLQQGRGFAYVLGGLSGVLALALLLLQPLFGAQYMPSLNRLQQQRWHRGVGSLMVILLLMHIAGLYVTSPDDMTDAMLLVAPTPFTVYGVLGFWSALLTAALVMFRRKMALTIFRWKVLHNLLAVVLVVASVVHSLMIEGAMGELSKLVLCIAVLAATCVATLHLRVVTPMKTKS